MLLLSESVKELVWLSENLRHQSVLVKVLDVEDLPVHLVVSVSCLVDICN